MNAIRQDQLRIIQEKYESSENNLEVILLKGETGIGKTYIIDLFLENYENKEVLISRSFCNYQTGKYEPYLPFKQLLSGLVDVRLEQNEEEPNSTFLTESFSKAIQALIDVAPDLIDTFIPSGNILTKLGDSLLEDVSTKGEIEDIIDGKKIEKFQLEEEQIHKQYLSFLRSLSEGRPIILVLEDMQWLDEASMNLLLPLTQKLQDCPILLIGSYRSTEVNEESSIFPVLNDLKRSLGSIELNMGFKDEEEKLSMIHSILDERENELDLEFREKLLSITSGNPMFVNEVMQKLEETQQVTLDSRGILQRSDDLSWSEIPDKLEAIVIDKLSKIEDSTRSLLSSASVQGKSFLAQILGQIEKIEDRDLLRLFARSLIKEHKLLQEGKVQRLNKKILSYFYFSNGLIQHYLYNDLMLSERMLYHQDIAEVLVEMYKEEYDQSNGLIAYHYEKGGLPEKAVVYYENAGKDSVKLSAFKEAAFLFNKALQLIDPLIEEDKDFWEPVKLRLLVQNSIALKPNEGWISAKVIDLYSQAYEIGIRLNDYETLAPVTFGLWVRHLLYLELEEALKFANSYHEITEKIGDTAMILDAKISISNTFFWMGNVVKSLEVADEVIELFDEDLHKNRIHKLGQDPRAFAYLFKILSLSLLSRKEEAHELAEQSLEWAKSLNHPFTEAIILQAIAWLYFQENESVKIKEVCSDLIGISKKYDFGFYLGIGQIFSACGLLEEEEFEEATTQLDIGFLEELSKDGSIVFNSIYQLLKSRIEFGQKKFDESLTTIDEAISVAEEQKELVYYPLLLRQKAKTLIEVNRSDESVTVEEKANNFSNENRLTLFLN